MKKVVLSKIIGGRFFSKCSTVLEMFIVNNVKKILDLPIELKFFVTFFETMYKHFLTNKNSTKKI